MHAFDVATYLGRRYFVYATTEATCRERRAAERAAETSTAPERQPFTRTRVLTDCYAAAMAAGGYAWAVTAEDAWGVVMPTAALCDAMREMLAPSVAPSRLTPCQPVTLTRR